MQSWSQVNACNRAGGAVDVCKIKAGLYQYTAIDDCTGLRVLNLYKQRSAANSIDFLDKLIEEFHYPVQRIQTDRGQEFFAVAFQERLMEYCIAPATRQI